MEWGFVNFKCDFLQFLRGYGAAGISGYGRKLIIFI